MKDLFGNDYDINETTKPIRGKFNIFRNKYSYKKSNSDKKCKNCNNRESYNYHNKNYHKCKSQGISHSESSDIRLINVCDLWEASCQEN